MKDDTRGNVNELIKETIIFFCGLCGLGLTGGGF